MAPPLYLTQPQINNANLSKQSNKRVQTNKI